MFKVENSLHEYLTVFIVSLMWCLVTHSAHVTGRFIFPKLKMSKNGFIVFLEIVFKVFYFSGFLYLFNSTLLPLLANFAMRNLNIHVENEWMTWAATLGITLGLSLPQLKEKMEYIF